MLHKKTFKTDKLPHLYDVIFISAIHLHSISNNRNAYNTRMIRAKKHLLKEEGGFNDEYMAYFLEVGYKILVSRISTIPSVDVSRLGFGSNDGRLKNKLFKMLLDARTKHSSDDSIVRQINLVLTWLNDEVIHIATSMTKELVNGH